MKRRIHLSKIILFASLLVGSSSFATIRYAKPVFTGTGDGSSWANASGDIQKLINLSSAGDEIWVSAGTYYPTRRADVTGTVSSNSRYNAIVLKSGVKIYGGFVGGETALSSRNWKTNLTTISGDVGTAGTVTDNCYHVIVSSGDVTTACLDGFTITGGYSNATSAADISVNGNTVSYSSGSAIFCIASSPALTNLTIKSNTAYLTGGGIYCNGSSPTITSCSISSNTATTGYGGGIASLNSSNSIITGCTLTSNTTQCNGGGAYVYNSSPQFISCTITNNSTTGSASGYGGGGMAIIYGSQSTTINYCNISNNNTTYNGGGIFNSSSFTLTNSLISENTATKSGAGIYTSSNTPTATNSTIVYNTSGSGAGGIDASAINVNNSIVYGNLVGTTSTNTTGSITYKYSLVEGGTVSGTTIISNAAPLFKNLATGDYSLQGYSPAVDAGDKTLNALSQDIAGNTRVYNNKIDLGAYEYQSTNTSLPSRTRTVYVNASASTGANNGTSWKNAYLQFSDALLEASTSYDILNIYVAKGTYYPQYTAGNGVTTRDKAFVLQKDVKIYGGYSNTDSTALRSPSTYTTTLSGDLGTIGTNTDNAYHVVISSGDVGTACLDGFTITGGYCTNTGSVKVNTYDIVAYYGAGVYCKMSAPLLNNLIITSNYNAIIGGGLYCENAGSPTVTNSTISSNTATTQGGGVGCLLSSTPTFTGCTINGNTSGTSGGGLYIDYSSPAITNTTISANSSKQGAGLTIYTTEPSINSGVVNMTNVSIKNNTISTGGTYGGGLYCATNASMTCKFKMTNCLVAGNTSINYGAGIFSSVSACVILNSTITSNTSSAWTGGGLYGNFTLQNSIVYGNSPSSNSGTNTYNYCLIEGGTVSGTSIVSNSNPLFKSSTDFSLQSASPALNVGNNSYVTETNDLAGNARISTGTVDLGAYEYQRDRIAYVNASATGKNNGKSWKDAYTELSSALTECTTIGNIAQINVAKGTYYPQTIAGSGSGNRDKAFVLQKDVKIYGGYSNTDSTAQRSPSTYTTVLSGDLGTIGTISDNCYHVVIAANSVGVGCLDGFTITGGNADNTSYLSINSLSVDRSKGAGLMCFTSSPTLNNLIITGNTSTWGGGLSILSSSAPAISNISITANTATLTGGAILINNSSPVISNIQVTKNTSTLEAGGILHENYSTATIINGLIANNTAGASGGGFYNQGGAALVLLNCAVVYNKIPTGSSGGGVYDSWSGVTLRNSIVWGNKTTANTKSNLYGNLTYSYSLIENGTVSGTSIISNSDPLFKNASGGNFRLNGYSPAVNVGSNSLYTTASGPSTDLDNNTRFFNSGTIDLGPYEYQSTDLSIPARTKTIYVNSSATGTNDGTSWKNAYLELADAFTQAASNYDVANIYVAKGTYYPQAYAGNGNSASNKAFVLLKDIKIYGGYSNTDSTALRSPADNETILDGNSTYYHVVISSGNVGTAVLDGFTITGGYSTSYGTITVNSNTINDTYGAGIFCINSSPQLSSLNIKSNTTIAGAGLYCYSGSPVINSCSISSNASTNGGGGGIGFEGSSSATVSNTKIFSNTSSYNGGGLWTSSANLTLVNLLIYKNTAAQRGGAIYTSAAINLVNSTIAYNSVPVSYGCGGIEGSTTLKNCILWGNTASSVTSNYNSATFSYCLVENGTVSGTSIISNAAPMFSNVATDDYSLKGYSPAVNVGNNSLYLSSYPTSDLAGNLRIYANGTIDLGAYEYQSTDVTMPARTRTIYVNTSATGTNKGTSWTNAYKQLSDALLECSTNFDVSQIWVAKGTYNPQYYAGSGTANCDKAFVLQKDVKMFGGFVGTETLLSQRDWQTNKVILDGISTSNHVVISAGDVGTACLDGFTITNGNAATWSVVSVNSYALNYTYGGALYLHASSPKLVNLKITANKASNGAGIACLAGSSPLFINSIIYKNTASAYAGAIYCDASSPTLTNTDIVANGAAGWTSGYGIYASNSSTPVINNSILWKNYNTGSTTSYNDVASVSSSTVTYHYCLVGTGTVSGTGIISNSDPKFTNETTPNYVLKSGSPAIDAGENSYVSEYSYDVARNGRILGAKVDLGSYEYTNINQWKGTTSTNSEVASNWSLGTLPVADSYIEFNASATNDMVLTADRSFGTIVNASTKVIKVNGKKMTLKGLYPQGVSKFDATASGSTVVFAGSTNQALGTNDFKGDSIRTLIISNTNNVALSGSLHVDSIAATTGALDALSYSPTVYYSGRTLAGGFLTNACYNLVLYKAVNTINDFQINNQLTLGTSASLTIPAGKKINVLGTISNLAGTGGILVKASSTAAGGTLLFHNSAASPVLGTVEMYSKAFRGTDNKFKWQYMGIPVKSLTASAAFSGAYLRHYNEANASYWETVPTSGTMSSFEGYALTQTAGKTYTIKGTLENSDMSYNLSYTSGMAYPGQHILGNPYTAAIDITKLTFTNTEATVYQYNTGSYNDWYSSASTSGSSAGQYIASTKYTAGSAGVPLEIPPMQGFMVNAYSGGGKLSYSYNNLTKSTTMQRASAIYPEEKICTAITVDGSNFSDRMWLFTSSNCTEAFDNGWDAGKMIGVSNAPQLYSTEGSTQYQINTKSDINNSEIAFIPGTDSSYKMTIVNTNTTETYPKLYLIDRICNTSVDISADTTVYSFIASGSDISNRFKIATAPEIATNIIKPSGNENVINVFSYKKAIHIKNELGQAGELQLYSASGKIINTYAFGSQTSTILNTELIPGIYYARVYTNSFEKTFCLSIH